MKIEQLIVQHLYNNKKVSLQDIGTFYLSPDTQLPGENDKEVMLPENAIKFEANKKAQADNELIDYIVAQTRKIKPLATSDLESYSILARQFLNIGKPFPIEGLGVLLKNQSGEYDFFQGDAMLTKNEAAPVLLKEKKESEISFSAVDKKEQGNKSWMIVALVLFFVVITGGAIYYFVNKGGKNNNLEPVASYVDTTKKDTPSKTKDSVSPELIQPVTPSDTLKPAKDSFNFKIVIKEYPDKRAADIAFAKLTSYGHKLLQYPKDSTTYKIAMPFKTPLSDTTAMKDSIRILFGGHPYVEKQTR